MKPAAELLTTADYARVLRPHLPPEAFRAEPRHLARIALHLVLLLAGYWGGRELPLWAAPLCALLIGHSITCLALLAHDVSHHAVVRSRLATRVLELLLFGPNMIPPTLWRRIHNQTHHVETNTDHDTDRPFRACEETLATRSYTRGFFPNRKTPFRHPFVLFHFVTYIVRHTFTALLPDEAKPSIVTAKPRYTGFQRLAIFVEIVWLGALQFGIWHLVGGEWARYVWASPVALLVASSVMMAYVFTNHFLNPLCEHADPLIGSTSVIVPRWVDWLHDNFSYHTEHHVFPGMNPRHFPAVSRLLAEHFSERYQRIPFREAWRRLWSQDEFIRE
jgi:fatty acid desaturase